jgi:hypothetical protein
MKYAKLLMPVLPAAAAAAAPVGAAEWRAVTWPDNKIAFVNADTVRRHADGRIRFAAEVYTIDPALARAEGFDQVSMKASGRCNDPNGRIEARAAYFRAGKAVKPKAARREHRASLIAFALCKGYLGQRAFFSPDAALQEHRLSGGPLQRLGDYRSKEVELTGTAVQGFEMNGITLCGSEAGCVDDAPWEFCWMEGPFNVPVSDGVDDGTIRRDTADIRLKGRITRSRDGRGFGHLSAFGCLVEQTGPAQIVEITQRRPDEPKRGERGRTPEAARAHAALDAAFANVGAVTARQAGHSWPIDQLKARPQDWEATCGSDLYYKGASPVPYPTAIMWGDVAQIDVVGATLTILTHRYDRSADYQLATPAAARRFAATLKQLQGRLPASVAVQGRRLTIRFTDGQELAEDYGDAGLAIQAAAIVEDLRGKEFQSVWQRGNQVNGLLARRVVLTFEDAEKAQAIAGLLGELRRVCSLPGA